MLDKTELPKWQIQFAFTEEDKVPSKIDKISKTVPDMTIKLNDLVERYRRGNSNILEEQNLYSMNIEDNPLPTDVDFTEIHENAKRIAELEKQDKLIANELTELKKAQLKADQLELEKYRAEKTESEAEPE